MQLRDIRIPVERTSEPRVVAVALTDFLKRGFPPRRNLLDPWLPEQGLCLIYAPRGVGKTYFALSVAHAIASGGSLLEFVAPEPQGVLYIDGEMPARTMQERLGAIVRGSTSRVMAPFKLITPDLQDGGMPRLDCEAGQAAIENVLTPDIKLIVCDNLSTLTSGVENDASDWLPVQRWVLQQRAIGRSVLLVHHAGKGGQQRGTSRREDVLDTVLSLKRPAGYTPDQGAAFELHFEKSRGSWGSAVHPIEAKLIDSVNGGISWEFRGLGSSCTLSSVVKLINEGMAQAEVARKLGVNRSTVSRALRKAREQGMLGGR